MTNGANSIDFVGFDLLLFVNLTDLALDEPLLKAGSDAPLALQTFGPGGADLLQLDGFDVYVTLIPEATGNFSLVAEVGGEQLLATTKVLEDGQALYLTAPGLLATVDQQLASDDAVEGDVPWQRGVNVKAVKLQKLCATRSERL